MMRRPRAIPFILLSLAPAASGQQAISLTQSTSMSIVPGSPACAWGGGGTGFQLVTSDNQYWRSFSLASIPAVLAGGFTVQSVTFGVEEAAHPTGSQVVTIDLYKDLDGGAPVAIGIDLIPIASIAWPVPNTSLSLITAPIGASLAKTDTLVVRISAPSYIPTYCPPPLGIDPNPAGEHAAFYMGSNRLGQTAPGYLSTTGCSILTPITLAAMGFPTIDLVLRIDGATAAAACYANCDNSSLPPILNVNDFTCFLNKFAAGDPSANCDSSSLPPVLNVNDFLCFMNRFATGCP